MAKVLTAAAVERYRPANKRREIRDGGAQGLYLIIQPKTGAKVWALRFRRPDGRPAKLTLGPVDLSGKELEGEPVIGMPLSLRAARLLAAKVHRDRQSKDVVADRKAAKHRALAQIKDDAANTFAAAARLFIDEHARPKTRRWRETARILGWDYSNPDEPVPVEKSLSARWSDKPVRTIDAHDIFAVIDEAKRLGIPGIKTKNTGKSEARARAMHSALSVMFSWLRSQRRIDTNPCVGIDRPAAPKARERVLTSDEIRWFWHACTAADAPRIEGEPRPIAPALRLLLLTGQRLNEVAGMRRSEIHGDDWHLPSSRTKNKRPHIVPLVPQTRALLPDGNSDLVFTTTGKTPVSGWSKAKDRVDAAMLALARKEKGDDYEIEPWVLHDLRRTAVTGMNDIGILPHVIEATVNHVSGTRGGVAGIYNRSLLLPERRAALERWAAHVEGLVSGTTAKVVPISKRKRS